MAFCGRLSPPFITTSTFSPSFHRQLVPSARVSGTSLDEGDGDNGGSLSSVHLKSQGNGADSIQLHQGVENRLGADSSDVMKLFNDVQQNMLFLNKQRVDAVDQLQKVEREKDVLLARISLLDAELETVFCERDLLRKELQVIKSKVGGRGKHNRIEEGGFKSPLVPSPVFSELVLHIDSMVLTGAINVGQASLLKSLALKQDVQAANVFSSLKSKGDEELASGLLPLLDPNRRYGFHITHICTELDPVVTSGALGDFVIKLSHALQKRGNLVEVILPKYATMNLDAVQDLRNIQVDFRSFFGRQWHKNRIWTGVVHGIAVTFIESLHPGGFFLRDHLYNYSDDFERFSYFCRAALEYILKAGKQPDVLHLHNWQTALAAPMFWDLFAGQGLGCTRILFTCNNFQDQCLQEPGKLGLCGLDPGRLHRADRLQDNLQQNLVNILKGGIVYANKVTTVPPVYAFDVISHEQGLQSTLMAHKNKIVGICNGLDMSVWNPATDANLPSVYSLEDLSGKLICKREFKQKLGLDSSDDSVPLIGCIAPQVSESEFEMIKAALDCAITKGCQFVFMVESKIAQFQRIVEDFQSGLELLICSRESFTWKDKGGKMFAKYDDTMAHQVIAASDILICASVNEATAEMPLIAMQYGSIPITKQQELSEQRTEANAFAYRTATALELMNAMIRAIDCKVNEPQRWQQLIKNGMSKDFSWDGECVEGYLDAYKSIKQL